MSLLLAHLFYWRHTRGKEKEREGGKKPPRKDAGYDVNRIGRPKAVTSIPILLGHYRQLLIICKDFTDFLKSFFLRHPQPMWGEGERRRELTGTRRGKEGEGWTSWVSFVGWLVVMSLCILLSLLCMEVFRWHSHFRLCRQCNMS